MPFKGNNESIIIKTQKLIDPTPSNNERSPNQSQGNTSKSPVQSSFLMRKNSKASNSNKAVSNPSEPLSAKNSLKVQDKNGGTFNTMATRISKQSRKSSFKPRKGNASNKNAVSATKENNANFNTVASESIPSLNLQKTLKNSQREKSDN